MIICLSVSVSAEGIQPYYLDTNKTQITLSFSSGKATCSGTITGKTGTTSISDCTVTLTDSKGNVVKSWSNLSSSGTILAFTKTSSGVTKGETYTLSVKATVNRNGSSETVSDSVSNTY
jgi:hypothetical protein